MDGAADGFFAEALAVYYHRLRPADFYRRAFKLEFDHRRVRPFAFDTLVHDFFGDQGYRFLMGISGLVIILCGLVFLFLS
jgi:hypothetical protein